MENSRIANEYVKQLLSDAAPPSKEFVDKINKLVSDSKEELDEENENILALTPMVDDDIAASSHAEGLLTLSEREELDFLREQVGVVCCCCFFFFCWLLA